MDNGLQNIYCHAKGRTKTYKFKHLLKNHTPISTIIFQIKKNYVY